MDNLSSDIDKIFAGLAEQVGGVRPTALSEAYLKAMREIEDLPCNQPGQDKSWVLRSTRGAREFIRSAKRLT